MMLLEIKDNNGTHSTESRLVTGFGKANVINQFRMYITLGMGCESKDVEFFFDNEESRDAAYQLVVSKFDPMPPKPADATLTLLKQQELLQKQLDNHLSPRDQMAHDFAKVHYADFLKNGCYSASTIPKSAYLMADAMIAEGRKGGGDATAAEPVPNPRS